MVVVTKKKGQTKDSLFRDFTKIFISEEIIEKLREKQFYKKPSRLKQEKLKARGKGGKIKKTGPKQFNRSSKPNR